MRLARQSTQHVPASVSLVIFLTGFAFLVYEVSWNRLLSLVLGSTVTASTVVLASFMAGFGVGAWYWGRRANRATRLGRLLALLMAGISLSSALAFTLVTHLLPRLYALLWNAGHGITAVAGFTAAGVLLFAPAFLMGGVFPTVSRVAVGSDESIAPALGRLYAVETLGSAVGGLAAGFVLLGWLGQQNTVVLAVLINLALAAALLATRRFDRSPSEPATATPATAGASRRATIRPADQSTLKRTALLAAFVCGFAILSLQVFWIRIFRVYFTNTSYTFALVASVAILGLFAGSALFQRFGPKRRDYHRSMVRILLLMTATTALGLLLLIYLPNALMFPFEAALESPMARVFLLPLVASLLVVFPPSVFSGYAFPLACSMYAESHGSIGRDVGLVLMVNTGGCVAGPLVATFILMPLVGAAPAIILAAAILAGTALHILFHRKPRRHGGAIAAAGLGLALVVIVIAVARPEIRTLPPSFSRFDREVLHYRESVEGTLSVGQDRGTRAQAKYTYVNNSAVIGSTYDAVKVVNMVGHFPFFLNPDLRDVLVIGFGIGVTTSAIAAHSEVESIECVELVPGLKEAAAYYRDLNRGVVDDPRLRFIAGDGRHYLQLTPKKYDLISCDPTHPILGSGNLYTRDYFELCREHLKPGGRVSQYLPLHKLRTPELLGIIATFHSVFPHCTVWLGHYHAVLVGSAEAGAVDFERWSAAADQIGENPYFYANPYHLAATLVLDGPAIERLAADLPPNTDDLSYTEFFDPECLDDDNLIVNLRFFLENRTDPGAVFTNVRDPERLAQFIRGHQLLTESLSYRLAGDRQRGLELLQRACQVNPEDQELPFLIKLDY